MYAVEIRRFGEGVSEPMLQMRAWLGRHRIQPPPARRSLSPKHSRGEVLCGGDARAAATTDAEEGYVRGDPERWCDKSSPSWTALGS